MRTLRIELSLDTEEYPNDPAAEIGFILESLAMRIRAGLLAESPADYHISLANSAGTPTGHWVILE
jgi:hypothetical protein